MHSRLCCVLVGAATALCIGTVQADVAVCNSFGWRHGANTTCITRPSTQRPAQIVRAGKLYYWRPRSRTYCFENNYGNERCMNRLDLPRLRCVTQDEVTYCD
jgi:hypothetical protein